MTDEKLCELFDTLSQIDEVLTGRNALTSYTFSAREDLRSNRIVSAEYSLLLLQEELKEALAHTRSALKIVRAVKREDWTIRIRNRRRFGKDLRPDAQDHLSLDCGRQNPARREVTTRDDLANGQISQSSEQESGFR